MGKMSEFNAAFGLLQLKHIDHALLRRKEIYETYRDLLTKVKGISFLNNLSEKVCNYSYLPILLEANYPISRDDLYQKLKDQSIYARRYFSMYSNLPSAQSSNLPTAIDLADKVLCLPIYPDLSIDDVFRIVSLIKG